MLRFKISMLANSPLAPLCQGCTNVLHRSLIISRPNSGGRWHHFATIIIKVQSKRTLRMHKCQSIARANRNPPGRGCADLVDAIVSTREGVHKSPSTDAIEIMMMIAYSYRIRCLPRWTVGHDYLGVTMQEFRQPEGFRLMKPWIPR